MNLAQSQQLAAVPADVAVPAAAAAAAAAAKPQPRPRPLHDSFESAGVHAALRRLWAQLSAEAAERQRLQTWEERLVDGPPPAWVVHPDFAHAVRACDARRGGDLQRVMDLVRSFRRLREHLDALRLHKSVDPEPEQPMGPPERTDPYRTAALVRLCYGEVLEAYAALAARRICSTTEVPCCGAQQKEMAQLSFDAYCAALWTSAHAEYAATLDDLDEVTGGTNCADSSVVPFPELHLVVAAANAPDFIALYERSHAPKSVPKSAQTMLALLMRSTNAGSRGWESALASAVKESEGVARVIGHVACAAFSGLHPCVHPDARPRWGQRLVAARGCKMGSGTAEARALANSSPGPVKELMRLYLAFLLAEDPATLEALAAAQQPAGQLSIPPRSTSPTALQAAMNAFLVAGETLLKTPSLAERSLGERIKNNLTIEPRTRKKATARPPPRAVHGATAPLVYCASWLGGRGSHASAASAAGAALDDLDAPEAPFAPTAVSTASAVLSAGFRGAFLPFWVHAHNQGFRVSRLDEPQYRALHVRSPAHQLLAGLDDATTLRAQRAALATPDAPLLTLARACAVLGIRASIADDAQPSSIAAGGGARAASEAEASLLRLSAKDAAAVFVFARTSALRSQVLSYDLGVRTRELQLAALAKRLRLVVEPFDAPETIAAMLPTHATHVFCCTECRRIVNAVQDGSGKDLSFNEIGLSASMLRIDGDGFGEAHMRCAKRSSAALRTAVALEEAARELEVETRPAPAPTDPLPRDLRPATIAELPTRQGCSHTSDIAKMRRDIKSCIDQSPRATACGDVPLVRIPILGRAIRLFGDFYVLCTLCGCLAKTNPDARFGAEPCCMRCDFSMLYDKAREALILETQPKTAPKSCRYCGRLESTGTGTKFKVVFAPMDDTEGNAHVPPPLRTCRCDYLSNHRPKLRIHAAGIRLTAAHFALSYCPLHYRTWLHNSQRELPMNVILSHISARARPVTGAESGKRSLDEAERAQRKEAAAARGTAKPPPKRSRKGSTKLSALKRSVRAHSRAQKQR